MSAQGKRPWRTPALSLLMGKLSRGKNHPALTETTVPDGGTTMVVYTPMGDNTVSVYSNQSGGAS